MCFQCFQFKTRLTPRVRNWDCSKEPTSGHYKITDPYLSITPSIFSIDSWSYQLGNQCLPRELHFHVFLRTLYLDSIEYQVLTPTPVREYLGTCIIIDQNPQYSQFSTAFDRPMALNSIELNLCVWTLFLCYPQSIL